MDTGTPGVRNYVRWVKSAAPDFEFLKLSYPAGDLDRLDRCHGVVFTGGGDVHPDFYGLNDRIELLEGVNAARDRFELEAVERGMKSGLPMLCICRGMQLFNVAMGGTLIPDIRTAGFEGHRKGKRGDASHPVVVEPETVLHSIVGVDTGSVNTNHHQAVERVGKGLRVTACARDGIIEAMEWEHVGGRPFLQLVQWHPERISDLLNPFSHAIVEKFVEAVRRNQKN